MNQSNNRTTEIPCGIISLLPLGMSCRGRAEAFARSLQSRLRTLGTQPNESTQIEPENGDAQENTWLTPAKFAPTTAITNHQPAAAGKPKQDGAESYFDYDIPSSPAEDSEYTRLVCTSETTQNDHTPESGYVCAPSMSSVDNSVAVESSDSSSDDPFYDPECSDLEQRSLSLSIDYYDCDDLKKDSTVPLEDRDVTSNSKQNAQIDRAQEYNENGSRSSSSTDSLPKSQSTTLSTFTANTSESNNTIANDLDMPDFCDSSHVTNDYSPLNNECHTTDDKESISNHNEIHTHDAHSISTTEFLQNVNEVPEVQINDSVAKSTLIVEDLVNGHTSDNDIEDDDEPPRRPERLRRCSSLKTGKTPPGTPGRKKIVRFADVLGLDLADVRTFMDDIPKIPNSAYEDLQSTFDQELPISLGQRLDKVIVPLFQQPGALPNFLDVVQAKNVALENAAVTDPICLTITGLVRVRNLDFHKSVHVRYTLDAWQSHSDLQAEYVENSCDGFSDKYSFIIFGNSMEVGQRIEIALRFSCRGEQFWDNNCGVNYCFQCLPATTPQLPNVNTINTEPRHDVHLHDSWCGSSFY